VDPNTTLTGATTGAGCSAYAAGTFTGRIALIRRNGCAVSIKTANATNAASAANSADGGSWLAHLVAVPGVVEFLLAAAVVGSGELIATFQRMDNFTHQR
jgi:hypothetical protein